MNPETKIIFPWANQQNKNISDWWFCFTAFPKIQEILEKHDLSNEVISKQTRILQEMDYNSFITDETWIFQWCARNLESLRLMSQEWNTNASHMIDLITLYVSECLEVDSNVDISQNIVISSWRMDMSEIWVQWGFFLYGFRVQVWNGDFFTINIKGFQEDATELVA